MKKHLIYITFLLGIAGIVTPALAQTLASGPQVLTFFSPVDDTEQPYGLYLPPDYDGTQPYPLVIMLHGAGSNHRLALRRVFGKSNKKGETDVEASRYFPEWKDVPYIVASPLARGTMGYQGVAEQDVYAVLADVQKRFRIDENRIYLTGLSMGGGGTLWLGLTRPDTWAAIAAVCAATPAGTDSLAPNALNLPTYLFHGDADPVVPVTKSRDMVDKLKDLGTQVVYTEYEQVKHNSWENAYAHENVFAWFNKFKRNPYPEKVRFVSDRYQYNKAYWVQLDQLTPGTLAHLEAAFTGPNELVITTRALGAFTLNIQGHPQYNPQDPLKITLDGKKLRLAPGTLSLYQTDGRWQAGTYTPPTMAKTQGAEGPLPTAFAHRHIYVYGTADNPTPEVLKARMAIAQQAANWSEYRGPFLGRIMVFPRVVADAAVRPSDLEDANLILFGNAKTNSLIEKYSSTLPLKLSEEAQQDYGLMYIYPINNHYVVINEGLPWWTGSAAPFTKPFTALRALDQVDYVLFKNTVDDPVVKGRFTPAWQIPEEDRESLKIACPL